MTIILVADSGSPETSRMKFPVQTVNNYQSLTIVIKTPNPGFTGDIDPPLNLILDSLEVRFTKFARAVSGIQFLIFDLKSSRDLNCSRP